MQVGLACLKSAGDHIGGFDGDPPHPVPRADPGVLWAVRRAGLRPSVIREPHVRAARRGQSPLRSAAAAPLPVLGGKFRITVPSVRGSR